ncbi:NADPH-dependent 7-cyano-7-deazaguanine reductase QueF [Gilvimarinus xylanilyticus]|uniref:NADPH-dependent 7-cyano-7-deazaguanine reductase n=1 Tax=Gilvimarinus xylanilyticus TaxID=2944139 RepID=A0A9X2I369_9GAMM|nr:NADPH-dependent 7-cyano-7-deazaguanine reductase QueF [Gilvimarinus xylanilyticus]MCP8899151.1 NADPH-dependent 7-cyano-7-deazaguanine reductase QueF [Gilvimarinus xylanilyticus]
MATISNSPLGKTSAYVSEYDASLLFPIARADSRSLLGLSGDALPFMGEDVWTGYELSWLNPKGLPQVALLEFVLPCQSPHIVESKSIKLYLNSFNQTRFESRAEVEALIARDLSAAAGARVDVRVFSLGSGFAVSAGVFSAAQSLDEQEIEVSQYQPNSSLLTLRSEQEVSRSWKSDLLKSNCPVTGQPDWASVWVRYTGAEIDPAGLLRYIVSFREHQDFHEHCVERIYCDLMARCRPQKLEVYARYTRRGGLDINPYRSSEAGSAPRVRLVRQ